jgi:hypothetical protein
MSMALTAFWQAVAATPLAQYVASSAWAFPTLESVHVIAITTVIGTVLVMDLRLLGLASRGSKVTEISRDTLRWTWLAFAIALVTGSLLFMSKAADYTINPFFDGKMLMILLAGANMAVFHLVTWKSVGRWDAASALPMGARLAGGISLGLWVGVVFLARAVGFTLAQFTSS